MNKLFIGREKELQLLRDYIASDQSEFVAVYGRRRVGKTFLIQQVVGDGCAFFAAGMHKVPMRIQLANFMQGIKKHNPKVRAAKTWLEAFMALETYLEGLPAGRKIVFIDEMPWMDTPRSNFISGLEHFWNSWASWRNDIKLIVCGSATSWIINNLIKNRGGLHNRVTHKIPLKPFTLKECRDYFRARGFRLGEKQIAECYMVLGGVPFYLSKMEKGEGVAQNIDRLLFAEDGELHDEFRSLYNSLYKNAAKHIKIVTALAAKGKGLTRQEIIGLTKLPDNGKFSLMLEELESCGFIRSYAPFTADRRSAKGEDERLSPDTLYQLVDPFTLFHFQVMKKAGTRDAHFWTNNQNSHMFSTWSGLAFEKLCLNHEVQIRAALGISGVSAEVVSWFSKASKKDASVDVDADSKDDKKKAAKARGAQIDMLIDRADKTINVCEMKFWSTPYSMSAKDADDIERRVLALMHETGTDKNVIVTLVTTKGLVRNEHSEGVQKVVLLEELFC